MPTLLPYYIDAPTFTDASAVYTDSTLTTKAPDGYYQSGGIYREQSGGILGSLETCPICNVAECGVIPSGWLSSQYGVYDFDLQLGTDTGAWRVVAQTFDIPNGFFIEYDSTTYSSAVSSQDGYLAGPYFGNNATAVAYSFPGGSPYTLPVLKWGGGSGGTDFVLTGATETITVAPGDFTGSPGNGGEFNWFISKPNAEPQTASIRVIGCVGGSTDGFTLSNFCPAPLDGFTVAPSPRVNAVDACLDVPSNTYYNGVVGGVAGDPGLYDVMFVNSNAANTLAATLGTGFYGYSSASVPTGYFEIDANSVIVSIGTCPP